MTAIELLNKYDIRPSGLRIKILEYILSHKTHPTVDEIYESLIKDNPTLSRTTVYNTTKVLGDKGLVKVITIDGQQVRFDGDIFLHGHFRCKVCGKIYDFDVLEQPNIPLEGFAVDDTDIYCVGSCKNCNSNK